MTNKRWCQNVYIAVLAHMGLDPSISCHLMAVSAVPRVEPEDDDTASQPHGRLV